MKGAYYNEIDPYAAQWLRHLISADLIAPGDVDTRSIADVRPDDLRSYTQCHFFAGIGGWPLALQIVNWNDDRPVWTGSCPCQPFSKVGARKGFDDERHLWPVWRELIRECNPAVVFGEQVASATDWLGLVRSDLEAMGYAVGAMPIEAASAGAQHKRDRLWLVADATRGTSWSDREDVCGDGFQQFARQAIERRSWGFGGRSGPPGHCSERNWWPVESDVGRVAHGVPGGVDQLRALGNAIVPQVAAEFIGAFIDTMRATALCSNQHITKET